MKDSIRLMESVEFAAIKHQMQRRKGYLKIPYINHPIKVTNVLIACGVTDVDLLTAAILHDTLEDTDTSFDEIKVKFGGNVAQIVLEVTDDMSLPEKVRKELQVTKAPSLSNHAQLIKIADKICNMNDLIDYPINWSNSRKLRYVVWSKRVFDGCKGGNELLDNLFVKTYENALRVFNK